MTEMEIRQRIEQLSRLINQWDERVPAWEQEVDNLFKLLGKMQKLKENE